MFVFNKMNTPFNLFMNCREKQSLKLIIDKEEEYESTVPGTYYQLNTGIIYIAHSLVHFFIQIF